MRWQGQENEPSLNPDAEILRQNPFWDGALVVLRSTHSGGAELLAECLLLRPLESRREPRFARQVLDRGRAPSIPRELMVSLQAKAKW